MTQAERQALEYLGDPSDPFSSTFEVVGVAQLWGAMASDAAAWIEQWQRQGWVEVLSPEDAGGVTLLTLTAAGEIALDAARRAS
jgi:hypothetical protein